MVDKHAGFATALAMSQSALDNMLRALYFARQFNNRFSATVPSLGSDFSVTFDNLFLEAPQIVLSPANGGKVGLRLIGWGNVTVTPTDATQPSETQGSHVDMLILMKAKTILIKGRLSIQFDLNFDALASLSVQPFSGTTFSTKAQAYLNSDGLRGLFSLGVYVGLSQRLKVFPPFDVSFLGAVATNASTKAKLVVVEGAIVIGFDISTDAVSTSGNPTLLVNFLNGLDIAIWTNPVVVDIAFEPAIKEISDLITQKGGTLETVNLSVEEGKLGIVIGIESANGSVTIVMSAKPVLSANTLTMIFEDILVLVLPKWWAYLLVFLTAGVFSVILQVLIDAARGTIASSIQGSRPNINGLTQTFTLSNVSDPKMTLRITVFEFHTEGIFAGMHLEVLFPGPRLVGPTEVAAEELLSPQTMHPVTYVANLGLRVLPDDPALRVRWTVRVPGANVPLFVMDQIGAVKMTLASVILLNNPHLRVECRIYRVFGAQVTELFDDAITLTVTDRLNRSHPYVRWTHSVGVPIFKREADGSGTVLMSQVIAYYRFGYPVMKMIPKLKWKTRHSKIHRTAVPGRCRMASHYAADSPKTSLHLEYLDQLPFNPLNLANHRAEVCDYCFYGGPTGTVPRVLP